MAGFEEVLVLLDTPVHVEAILRFDDSYPNDFQVPPAL